jgi:hypothetical protein
MPNGKVGDHPLTDILIHKLPVFSREIDGLIVEIDRLGGRKILDRINWFSPPPLSQLTEWLQTSLEDLRKLRREQGWELG